jgi:hypothetical protein
MIVILLAACGPDMRIQAAVPNPTVPFSPLTATDWPVWPLDTGWLIGGSGYRLGAGDPTGLRPGIGLSLALVPSRHIGTWLGFPGTLPTPLPNQVPFPVWTSPGAPAKPAAASGSATAARPEPAPAASGNVIRWTKMGVTDLPKPVTAPWPKDPWLMAPWGPVGLAPRPQPSGVPRLDLGFPMADGTPVSRAFMAPFTKIRADGRADILFLDVVSRTIFRPPNLQTFADPVLVDFGSGFSLVTEPGVTGDLLMIEYLGGGVDPLPELRGVRVPGRASASQRAAFIAFTAGTPDHRRVALFDRRTRVIDPLSRLNGGAEAFEPHVDGQARLIAYVTPVAGQTDIHLYDTLTGLTDPLVAVNTGANERLPSLSWSGQWMAYITDAGGRSELRLYDRVTAAIDTLPDVNRLGPVLRARLAPDGLSILVTIAGDRGPQVYAYMRPTGIIDPLPELNLD